MYILNNMENLKDIPFTDKNPVLVDLENAATRLGMTYDEEVAYQRSLKRMWDYEAGIWSAKQEGLEEGIKEGIKEGKDGKAEGMKAMAMNLKSLGVDIDTISKASGLSKEEIEKNL